MKYIAYKETKQFLDVLKADIVFFFAKNSQKSTYVICSNGAPGWRTVFLHRPRWKHEIL
jgi:hypothetical protein